MKISHRYQSKVHFLFKEKTNHTALQLFRYSLVGGIAFLVDIGTLMLFTEHFGFHYLLAAALAFSNGISVNYFLSIKWVFNDSSENNKRTQIVVFAVIGLIGLGLNELLLWLFTDLMMIYYLISKMIAAVIVFGWNFFARKKLLIKYEKR